MGILSWAEGKLRSKAADQPPIDADFTVADKAPVGSFPAPTPAGSLANIIQPQPLYNQYQRVGGQLTPLVVSSILQSTDQGYMYKFVDLANEFRQKDNHLQTCLATREIALAGLPYIVRPAVKPGRDHATARAQTVADFCNHALGNAEGKGQEVRSFPDAVMHLAGGIYFGYGICETDWYRDGQYVVPRGFRTIPPRRFRYRLSDGKLVWWDSQGMTEEVDIQDRFPGKFVLHQPRVNGDAASREGLARVLVWAALFRVWDLSDWLKLAELSWKPWRRAMYKNTASREDLAALEATLDKLATNGYAVHSDRVTIDVEWPGGGRGARSEHHELCKFLGDEMSKATLGQTLTTQEGERGARSLGEVHDRVRKDIAEADSVAMASTIRRDFIAPLVRLNFGADEPIPRFEFITEDTPDIGTFSRGIQALALSGVRIGQDWVRDKIGAPKPKKDEKICSGQQALLLEAGVEPKEPGKPGDSGDKKDDEESSGSSGNSGGGE